MAIQQGSGLQGRIGNLIYYTRKGITCVRSLPGRAKRTPSAGQLTQRERFSQASRFLAPLAPVLQWSFEPTWRKRASGPNKALQYAIREAFEGEYPDVSLRPDRVRIASGREVRPPVITQFVPTTGGLLIVGWETGNVSSRDDAGYVLAYNESRRLPVLSPAGVLRSAGGLSMQLAVDMLGGSIHCYAFMKVRNGVGVSDSVFLGTITA